MRGPILAISFLISLSANAQLTNFSEIWRQYDYKGDQLYEDGLYEAAIEAYQKQLIEDPDNTEAIVRIAESYKQLGNYKMAGHYFHTLGRSFQLDEQYFEDYADVLLAEGNNAEALTHFRNVLENDPDNKVVREKVWGLENWDKFFEYEDYAKIESTPFNSESSEFGIRKYGNGLAFTSSRLQDGIIKYNYLRGVDKLTSMFSMASETDNNPALLEIDKYRKSNDGPHAKFGRDYVISRTFNHDKNLNAVLGLYYFQMDEDGKLIKAGRFPFNSPEYSISHPAYNDRGDTLFFVSDMPSGFGGFDIYFSIYRNNAWSAPVNIGEPVNTSRNELFPYSDKGKFYFSSDGHAGLGGLDIYQLMSKEDSVFVENIGSPVNSGWDDFGIYIEDNEGYISSNRPGGRGLDDIYKIKLLERPKKIEPVFVSLSLFDNLSDLPVDAAIVKVVSESGTVEAVSDRDGRISRKLMPGDYTVLVSRELYSDRSFKLKINEGETVDNSVGLEPAMKVHLISPDSIMFKFGEYALLHEEADDELDAIAQTLKDHPEFNLEISAHTDSRGGADYNRWLSEKRAETAANYIINKGIDPARIHQYGYGESRLLNNCRDGFKCSDNLHAVNRRLEFDFIRKELED